MITRFEWYTPPMTKDDYKVLDRVVPILVKAQGQRKAITNKKLCEKLFGIKADTAQIRKIISHIRREGIIECLVSSQKGYYVSHSPKDVKNYIDSLRQRSSAINAVADALVLQNRKLKRRK